MKTNITAIRRVKNVKLSPGKYKGVWNGARITIIQENGYYELAASIGIRGWADCEITVTDTGIVTAETTPTPAKEER